MTPTPKSEPVLTATLLVPVIVWLAAYFFPGTEVSTEQATIAATVVLAVGSAVARSRVRTKATLPDPEAVKPPPSVAPLLSRRVRSDRPAE